MAVAKAFELGFERVAPTAPRSVAYSGAHSPQATIAARAWRRHDVLVEQGRRSTAVAD